MKSLEQLEEEINSIKKRNIRVEVDKAWETSWARKILIFILTYIVIVIFFIVAKLAKPFLNPLVPAVAFWLSTLTVPIFKKRWMQHKFNKISK